MMELYLPPKPAIIMPAPKELVKPAMLPGMIPVVSAGGPPPAASSTFRGSFGNSANLTSYTFTAVDVGAANSARYVVVAAHHESGSGFTGCTIGGFTASTLAVANTSGQMGAVLYGASVPTGATVDIVVTLGSAPAFAIIGVWTLHDLLSQTPTDTLQVVAANPPLSGDIDIAADGVILAAFTGGVDATANVTWTGVTEEYDVGPPSGENCKGSGASFASSSAIVNRTVTANTSAASGNEALVAVAWR